ncbi:hypothetical protein BDV12DRAFT_183914 [Aspergillus spectabilis]
MEQPTHIIDPDGEVVTALRNANSLFAQPDEDVIAGMVPQAISEPCGCAQGSAEEIVTSTDHMENPMPPRRGKKKRGKRYRTIRASLEQTPRLIEEPVGEQPAEKPDPEPTERPIDEPPHESCFRIQVSAKHLMLASPVFKKILTGGWKENVTYLQKDSVEITAESWDIEALLVLFRAIHGRKLTLEILAKVAVLVDYYECKEAVYILTDIWISFLEEKIPTTYPRDLILWLWVSWFFQLPAQFNESTSTAMLWSDDCTSNLGLPILDKVMSAMNDCRHEAINTLIHFLHEPRKALLSSKRGCSFECGSIIYGALTKDMQSSDLLSLKHTTAFQGLNYEHLVQKKGHAHEDHK